MARKNEDATVARLAHRVPAVAEALGGIHVEHVYNLIRSGRLAHIRVGRHFLVPDAELQRFLNTTDAPAKN